MQPTQSALFHLLVGDALVADVLHYSVVPQSASPATPPIKGSTMPYIEPHRRRDLQYTPWNAADVGELTYIMYKAAVDYCAFNYKTHADVIAALDNAKEEYRRRYLNPYEDQKREENGDV